jgi:DNA-directed RNA polymerase III subunit RPC1
MEKLLIAAQQDFITSGYLMTQRDELLTRKKARMLATCMLSRPDSNIEIKLAATMILKPRRGSRFSLILRLN